MFKKPKIWDLQGEQNPNINYVVLFVAVFSPSTLHEISDFLYCNGGVARGLACHAEHDLNFFKPKFFWPFFYMMKCFRT